MRCTKCHEDKPSTLEYFRRDANTRRNPSEDGIFLSRICKVCYRAKYPSEPYRGDRRYRLDKIAATLRQHLGVHIMKHTTYHRAIRKTKPEYDYLAPNDRPEYPPEVRVKRVALRRKLTQIAVTLLAHEAKNRV